MAGHRQVLAGKFKEIGATHRDIAIAMGWKSAGTVGHKLTGRRDWSEGELPKMCALAGISLLQLSELSDDMPGYYHRKDIAEAVDILDKLPEAEFHSIMIILRSLKSGA